MEKLDLNQGRERTLCSYSLVMHNDLYRRTFLQATFFALVSFLTLPEYIYSKQYNLQKKSFRKIALMISIKLHFSVSCRKQIYAKYAEMYRKL